MSCFVMQRFCVLSGFAIILMGKIEFDALPCLYSWCLVTVSVLWLFLTVPWAGLQYVIVAFPIHTHCLDVNILFFTIVQW